MPLVADYRASGYRRHRGTGALPNRGVPGGMGQLLWDKRSSSRENPEVAMARFKSTIYPDLGTTRST